MRFIFIFLIFINYFTVYGQQKFKTIEICGRVSDSLTNKRLSDVALQFIEIESGKLAHAVISDTSGRFCLPKVGSQNYLVYISSLGYFPKQINFTPPEKGKYSYLKIKLSKNNFVIDEIAINGTQNGYKTQVDRNIFIPDSIHLKNSQTAYDMLKMVPGISIKTSDHSIKLLGNPNVMLLIDGVPSKRNLSAIKPIDIEKIEIIENPSAKYDSEIASIINVVLKEERKKGFKATANLQYFTKNRFNFSNIQIDYSSPKYRVFGMAKIKLSTARSIDSLAVIYNNNTNAERYNEQSLKDNLYKMYGNIYQYGFDY
ncbi:MAG: TonB-dependent receptor plug domain-containing protein [Salinivirgaceae bacterium]|nr:TonB-dependent receptor plug domain-containing protein [Salinivirgaceae bacterium]